MPNSARIITSSSSKVKIPPIFVQTDLSVENKKLRNENERLKKKNEQLKRELEKKNLSSSSSVVVPQTSSDSASLNINQQSNEYREVIINNTKISLSITYTQTKNIYI
jgi:cell division septum initiation protein DivIVA